MVGYARGKDELSKTQIGIAGATTGFITRFFCQPFDVIKIRFQLQVEPLKKDARNSKYTGMLQATRTIVKEEGAMALWKGHNPGQLLSIIYGVVQFVVFEELTKRADVLLPPDSGRKPYTHFVCGAVAGTAATVCSFPFDVMRTRFVAQGNKKIYKNMVQSLSSMVRREGPLALFKGLSPTLIQVAPHSGAIFAFHNIFSSTFKHLALFTNDVKDLNTTGNLVIGSMAGVCAKTLVYPFDLARKRLQLQGFQLGRQGFGKNFTCRGLVHCVWLTITLEGFFSLFKGLTPSMLKAAVTTSLYFTIYEETCNFLALVKK